MVFGFSHPSRSASASSDAEQVERDGQLLALERLVPLGEQAISSTHGLHHVAQR